MELLLSDPYQYLDVFLLVFVRVGSLFISTPILSNRNIPMVAKIGLAFFISLIALNIFDFSITVSSANVYEYAAVLIKEVFVGWMIGLGAYMVYAIITLAGQFIDQQVGFAMVNVFDPLSQVQFTITGTLYYYLVLSITILTDVHHYFIRAIIKSFELIPIGGAKLSPLLNDTIISFMSDFFLIALQIAAPYFFIMLLADVILGLLARTVPQMNLFVIGFPIKIFLGFAVLLITINIFSSISSMIIDNAISMIDKIIKGMMP